MNFTAPRSLPSSTAGLRPWSGDGARLASGLEVLAAAPLLQREIDARRGLRTGGLVTGYRGSPLAGLDKLLEARRAEFLHVGVHFVPALNEELGISMVQGAQEAPYAPDALVDGAFGFWYGKSPGLARGVDALRHANLVGCHHLGGAVMWVGDDPRAISTRYTHTSELLLRDACVSILAPSTPQELLDYSILGIALSRASGLWTALLVESDVLDCSQTVDFSLERLWLRLPPADDAGVRLSINELAGPAEALLTETRLPAAEIFLEQAFPAGDSERRGGEVHVAAAGQAANLARHAIVKFEAAHRGAAGRVRLEKVPFLWPSPAVRTLSGIPPRARVLVAENGRQFLTGQLRLAAYGRPSAPAIDTVHDHIGPSASLGRPPDVNEIAAALALMQGLPASAPTGKDADAAPVAERAPFFCAGCPANLSTTVPDGSPSLGGVGCHLISALVPEAAGRGIPPMGGEGGSWIGQSLFTHRKHAFQDLGDGTYAHSGSLAIRAALAAGTTITFKILINGVVAMTGGQPIEGSPDALTIARQVAAEGVKTIWVVSDRDDLPPRTWFPPGTSFATRDRLMDVQRQLRDVPGVSVLLFVAECAIARDRERGGASAIQSRLTIDEDLCEGCDDCVARTRCIAIDTIQTPFGLKRRIDPCVCNHDLACLEAECPAIMTVAARPSSAVTAPAAPPAAVASLPLPLDVVLAGVGGTSVLTASRALTRAAARAGLQVSSYSDAGLAQRGGLVLAQVRLAPLGDPAPIAGRAPEATAGLLLCTDPLTATQKRVLALARPREGLTAILGAYTLQQRDGLFGRNANGTSLALARAAARQMQQRASRLHLIPSDTARDESVALVLVGAALGRGLLPLAPEDFADGERGEVPAALLAGMTSADADLDLFTEPVLAERADLEQRLAQYGSASALSDFRALCNEVGAALGHTESGQALALQLAHAHYRLAAPKDALEVARLLARRTDGEDVDLAYHLRLFPARLRRRKSRIPARLARPFLMALASLRHLRGTPADPTRLTRGGRLSRRVTRRFEADVRALLDEVEPLRIRGLEEVVARAMTVRGYGRLRRDASLKYLAADGPVDRRLR